MIRKIMPQTRFVSRTFGSKPASTAGLQYWLFVTLLALGLAACERNGAIIAAPQYQATLVGDWQGTVGDEQETISFTQDGRFTAQLLRKGFLSNTLGQGEAGTIKGSWVLQGKMITLAIDSTDHVQPLKLATTSTIVSFKQNELVVSSDAGKTSTFFRAL